MALSHSPMNEKKRVKVYELKENDWFDRGTGFCSPTKIHEDSIIIVESEDDSDRTLLNVPILKEDIYQKQQDTLIVWTDPTGVDMALSFQEAEGCATIWNMISEVQHRYNEGLDEGPQQINLPTPSLGHLREIEEVIIRASVTQPGRDALAKLILSSEYISGLTPILEEAEDLEDLPDLHRLCRIMKTLILLNESPIIEYVVRDEIILGVVGALEYDPDFPTHKANHRQYLSDTSRFKEVVNIEDIDIKKKIHFTYRLQYLKDVVLARILDDPTFTVLNSLIFFHQVDIVNHIQSNANLLRELFTIVSSNDSEPQKKKDAVLFIQQSCAIAKSLQATSRASLYQNLIACGLFSTITFALQHSDALVRVAGTDILVAVIDHDALMMRSCIFKSMNEKTKPMTDTLIDLLLVETDLGIKAQIADAIKVLLDPNANGPSAERPPGAESSFLARVKSNAQHTAQTENFIDHFYTQSAKRLFQPLQDLKTRDSMKTLSIQEVSLYSHLVEILCFFLRQHGHRSKYYILSEGIASCVGQLLTCPEKHLKLAALKYFRTLLALQDEFHYRQLIQNHIFAPILDIVYDSMPRDNLLNSTCLELFEYIKRESVKPIILHLAETYRERLSTMQYVDTFQLILQRYDQFNNPSSAPQGPDIDSSFMTSDTETPHTRRIAINGGSSRFDSVLKDADAEEEAYFNASDGEDDEDELSRNDLPLPNGASPVKRLVDYDDDDEPLYDADDSMLDQPEVDGISPGKETASLSPPGSSSSPSAAANSPSAANAPSSSSTPPAPIPSPPSSIAEKRRREEDEDEDDELGKLSSGVKRRNSNITAKESSKGEEVEHTASKVSPETPSEDPAPEKYSLRNSSRRTTRATLAKDDAAKANKKIAISLNSGSKKPAAEDKAGGSR